VTLGFYFAFYFKFSKEDESPSSDRHTRWPEPVFSHLDTQVSDYINQQYFHPKRREQMHSRLQKRLPEQ
jgi:hypothetical protein